MQSTAFASGTRAAAVLRHRAPSFVCGVLPGWLQRSERDVHQFSTCFTDLPAIAGSAPSTQEHA
jgi:hypothetical protein